MTAPLPNLLVLLLLCSGVAHADGAPADPRIGSKVERFAPAWNAHDMAALAKLFAEDADFVNVVGLWWKSRAEIQAAHEATHRTLFKDSTLTGKISAVKLLRPDVATVHYTWSLVGMRAPDGQAIPERKGLLLFVLTRQGADWTIRTAQNTDIVEGLLAPPPPPKK